MQIGHGSRAHTPGWVVATLIAGAVILLPGAAWLQAKEKPDEQAAAAQDPAPAVSATLAALEPEGVVLKARMVVLEVPADRVKEIRPVIVQRPGVNDAATVLPVQSDQGSKGAALPVDSATPTTTPWIMDDASLARVEEWMQGSSDDKVKILCRPQLAMLNGSSASLTIGVERPFVVAVDAESGQPTVDIKHLGLKCKITATLPDVEPNATAVKRYRWVGVQCELTHTDMMKVEESVFTSKTGATTTLQKPLISSRKSAFDMNVPLGVTIATTAGMKDQDDGQRTTVWLITVDTLSDPTSDSDAQPVDAPDETDAKSEE